MGQINNVSAPVVLRLALLCLGITPSHLAWMFYAKFMQVISNTQTGAHQAWRGQWIALSNRKGFETSNSSRARTEAMQASVDQSRRNVSEICDDNSSNVIKCSCMRHPQCASAVGDWDTDHSKLTWGDRVRL